jgi:hypothetical protein
MWNTSTYWFDVSVVFGVFAIGSILLGHFEEHRPKWRRLLKVAMILGLALLLSYYQLRWAFYLVLFGFALAAAYIHVIWLPKQGIHGWTGEPRDKYLELVKGKKPQD